MTERGEHGERAIAEPAQAASPDTGASAQRALRQAPPMPGGCEVAFRSMASEVRLLVGPPLLQGAPSAVDAAQRQRAYVEAFAERLSRFRQDSELSALNDDPRDAIPCSPLLRTAVQAGIWAARRSGGLVDPTLGAEIERAGYVDSLDRRAPACLLDAIAQAPARRPARPSAAQAWRSVTVEGSVVRRPAGLKIDTGGVGKGLCADAIAHSLSSHTRVAVDCGGDIAVGGVGATVEPFAVEVEHPLTGETVLTLALRGGGVATSGLNVRLWRREDGGFAHHLLDPSTGAPAWTGLIGATALGGSALEAETLSKAALLLGPKGARRVLCEHGGLIVHDDGEVEQVGALPLARGEEPWAPALWGAAPRRLGGAVR